MFQQQLALAAATNLQNIEHIYRSSQNMKADRTKGLWQTSGNDPYGDTDPDIGKAVDNIVNVAERGYSQAKTQGMPAKGQFGYAGFLTNMDKAIQNLDNLGPFPKLDPKASSALDELKKAVYTARSEFIPVGIPAPVSVNNISLPEDTIYGRVPKDVGGAAYTAPSTPPAPSVTPATQDDKNLYQFTPRTEAEKKWWENVQKAKKTIDSMDEEINKPLSSNPLTPEGQLPPNWRYTPYKWNK